jgi:NAD-dependent dihydropyrimidine dehydrogenase PreA subunit
MKTTREIILIDEDKCTGCGLCVPGCAEGALQIVDGKAKMLAEKYCDGLGACLGTCPEGALTIEVREADPFDEVAVEELLQAQKAEKEKSGGTMPCGCPSGNTMSFAPMSPCAAKEGEASPSALGHWPVKLKLVNAETPFLQGVDLLLAADCVPAAFPGYHEKYLPGRAVLIGCPKFDDADVYVAKLAEIFSKAGLKTVTILEMEVPCCANMSKIVERAYTLSGSETPVRTVIISRDGRELEERDWSKAKPLPVMS